MVSASPIDPLFLPFQLALAGRDLIDRELGRGGMGTVFLAREVHLERPVANKLIPPDKASQPSLWERFLREARLHAGSSTVEGLTTQLGLAAEVSEEIERLIAAHDETERGLHFPLEAAPTPV